MEGDPSRCIEMSIWTIQMSSRSRPSLYKDIFVASRPRARAQHHHLESRLRTMVERYRKAPDIFATEKGNMFSGRILRPSQLRRCPLSGPVKAETSPSRSGAPWSSGHILLHEATRNKLTGATAG